MPVKLSVVNEQADDGSPSTYLFQEDEVTIGRGEENHLTLSDPKRVVSTEHAMVRRENGTYRLIDRGSKNFTYVGNQRITAQDPYKLADGDIFRVGDFRIEFQVLETDGQTAAQGGETVFDYSFENPMEEQVGRLVDALNDLSEAYRETAPQRRDDVLAEAVEEVDDELDDTDAVDSILSALGGDAFAESASGADPGTSSISGSKPKAGTPGPAAPTPSADGDEQVRKILYRLGDALATVIRIPWRFRHEFIGQTVMQAPETQFLYAGDGDTLVEHLLDSSLSAQERDDRLNHVKEAAESLQVHQVAMLNGYKASVMSGVEELLSRLSPIRHRKEVMQENALFEYVPILASPRTLDRIRRQVKEWQREDGTSAETRIFRPAFTKAYLARMTAPQSGDDDESGTAT